VNLELFSLAVSMPQWSISILDGAKRPANIDILASRVHEPPAIQEDQTNLREGKASRLMKTL